MRCYLIMETKKSAEFEFARPIAAFLSRARAELRIMALNAANSKLKVQNTHYQIEEVPFTP